MHLLQAVMTSVVYEVAACLLLLVAVRGTSVQPKQIIYVDKVNGTLDPSSWTNNAESLHHVELHNSAQVVVNHGCKHEELQESATYVPPDQQCPTWFFPDPSSNGTCRCGDSVHNAVRCNESTKEVAILDCYCMTYYELTGPVVGACFYNCMRELYYLLPSDVTKLNNNMCGYLNRAGQLCGECKENYSIPVYSYDLKCVQCSTSPFNWILYILAAFLPLTVFLVLVVCFRLSVTSPKLLAFVFFSQTLAIGPNVRIVLALIETVPYPIATSLQKIIFTLYGFWNLDFFRTLLPHICVKINTLQTLALDYAVAIYPLILLVVTYVLIQVRICNFRIITFMCRPFHRCANCLRSQLDARTSIVDAFATFLLLSYVKLLSVSFDLLVPTQVYNINGSLVGLYLYYDATIEYFGEEHLPYALLAVFVLLVFIIFPLLLLLLYPMRCFQRCLGCIGVRWHALPIFIDAFQGCYKDGTNGTRDCRYFAAAFLLARILLFIIFTLTQTTLFYGVALLVYILLVMVIVTVQPYKPRFSTYNAVDSVLVLLMALWCAGALCTTIAIQKAHQLVIIFLLLTFIVELLPLFYLSFITLHWVCSRGQLGWKMVGRVRGWIGGNRSQSFVDGSEESLPDRLINPNEYEEDLTSPVAVQVEDNSSYQSSNSNAYETAY